MMTDKEFSDWCKQNQIGRNEEAYVQRIRTSQPNRSVGGGRNNTFGTYPSHKMGLGIQFESRTGELSLIYHQEHDDDVLEFYDQPFPPLKLKYRQNGRNVGPDHTADSFEIRKNGAGYIEFKPENELLRLSEKHPERYHREPSGAWRCPPGERAASQWGLTYRVVSSSDLNPIYSRNMQFLEDYIFDSAGLNVDSSRQERICKFVKHAPGVPLARLIKEFDYADDIYRMILMDKLFIDLDKYALAEYQYTRVYEDSVTAMAYDSIASSVPVVGFVDQHVPIIPEPGEDVFWDGRKLSIVHVGTSEITMQDEKQLVVLSHEHFNQLAISGKVKGGTASVQLNNEVTDRLLQASEQDLCEANRKYKIIEPILLGNDQSSANVPGRTLRQWLSDYREATQIYGTGYIGLLPKPRNGNRKPRLDSAVEKIMEDFISNSYLTKKKKSKSEVYGEVRNACKKDNLVPPSYPTFLDRINRRPVYERELSRSGPRAAYSHEPRPMYWVLDRHTPRHGDRPFEWCHIDHTVYDLELSDSQALKNLGKVCLTVMVDAFDRRFLAHYLSYDGPSNVNVMMVIRECVRRHHRLPQFIVVDNGKEFHSTYFETLLTRYFVKKVHRPAHKSRFGSVIERMIGTSITSVANNTAGNTQPTKNVRTMTKSFNPKLDAPWTLEEFNEHLSEFLYEVYDTRPHPALGQSPRDAFESAVELSGHRPMTYIAYDEHFYIMTHPAPVDQSGMRRLDPNRGFKLHNIWYWHEDFYRIGTKIDVPVRFDPYDVGTAYAYVNKRWVRCASEYHHLLAGRSIKEIYLISEELRRQNREIGRQFNVNAERLAEYIQKGEHTEAILRQRKIDFEVKSTFTVIPGGLSHVGQNFPSDGSASTGRLTVVNRNIPIQMDPPEVYD